MAKNKKAKTLSPPETLYVMRDDQGFYDSIDFIDGSIMDESLDELMRNNESGVVAVYELKEMLRVTVNRTVQAEKI